MHGCQVLSNIYLTAINESGDERTAESNAGGGNDAGLNNSVLLPGKRLPEHTRLLQELGPCLDEEEAQKPGGDVEGRDNSGGQVQLHDDEGEENPKHKAHHKGPQSQLPLP